MTIPPTEALDERRQAYERWREKILTVDGRVYRLSGELEAGPVAFVDVYVGRGPYDPSQDMLPATVNAKGEHIPARTRPGRWRGLPWGPRRRKVMGLAGFTSQAESEAACDVSLRTRAL